MANNSASAADYILPSFVNETNLNKMGPGAGDRDYAMMYGAMQDGTQRDDERDLMQRSNT